LNSQEENSARAQNLTEKNEKLEHKNERRKEQQKYSLSCI
jgi:hypothetical protein